MSYCHIICSCDMHSHVQRGNEEGGIIGGIAAVALLPFTVSAVAVGVFGGTIGLTAGLVEGAAMESTGVNTQIENIEDYIVGKLK